MSQNKGFRHFRNQAPRDAQHTLHNKGGVTMAFSSPKHINDLTASDKVEVAFAFCSSDDNFEHNRGRVASHDRLTTKGDSLTVPGDYFQQLLHAPLIQDLLPLALIYPGLNKEQTIAFRSLIKRTFIRAK